MGHVYRALALACQAFYSKEQVVVALVKGVSSALLYLYRYNILDDDFPDIDRRFRAVDPEHNPHWHSIRRHLLGHLRQVSLDTEYLAKELNNIAADIFVLGATKRLAGAERDVELLLPSTPILYAEIPTTRPITAGEEPSLTEEPELAAPQALDPRLAKATLAYLESGILLARLVYLGEEDYAEPKQDEVTQEEANDFLSELQEMEEEEHGGQAPDERV